MANAPPTNQPPTDPVALTRVHWPPPCLLPSSPICKCQLVANSTLLGARTHTKLENRLKVLVI